MEGQSVTLVIPVLNEIQNLPSLLHELNRLLAREERLRVINELIVVDDGSTDGTKEFLSRFSKTVARWYSFLLIERHRKSGTMSAELCGCKNSSNELIIKMDGDGQHPLGILEKMIDMWNEDTDCIVASRYVKGGMVQWSLRRELTSRMAKIVAYSFLKNSRSLKDPLSGYFMIRKSLIMHLQPYDNCYKLLLHILATNANTRILEIPYMMADRRRGTSKIVSNRSGFVVNYFLEVIRYRKLSILKQDAQSHLCQG